LSKPFKFLPQHRLFISDDGDYNSGGTVVDTRLWSAGDWKRFEDSPRVLRPTVAIKITLEAEKSFEDFMESFRDAGDVTDIEVKRYVLDDDGVTEVDEDNNPV